MTRQTLWTIGRLLLFVLGVGLVWWLVERAGPGHVAEVLLGAGPWLPVIVLLETGFLISDTFALRSLLGESARNVPMAAWFRSAMQAYALMTLLPAGRAAGEVARAATLSLHVDKGHAALASTRLNAAYMLANALMSLVAAIFAIRAAGLFGSITGLAAVNVLATGSLGTMLILIPRSAFLKGWIRRKYPKFAEGGFRHLLDEGRPPVPFKETAMCFAARCAQCLQYGVVLVAVGGVVTLSRAVLTLGLHLFGATIGGAVPSQVGVNEGTYATFAEWMGLGGHPEKALSVALLVRVAQLGLALVCLLGASLLAPKVSKGTEAAAAQS